MEGIMELCNTNICKAIDTCIEKGGYKVGIVCMHERMGEISEVLYNILRNIKPPVGDHIRSFICNKHRPVIYFKNGSFIKIFNASADARGHKFNSLLLDEGISDEIVRCVLMPYLVKY